jgi:hypothetical protein
MRFFDDYPYGYEGHNTGGEHLIKHFEDPTIINSLRLRLIKGVDSWDIEEIRGTMLKQGDAGDLVNLIDSERRRIVGGALVRYEVYSTSKTARLDLSDIVIEYEARGKGISNTLVSKALSHQHYGHITKFPDLLVISDRNELCRPETTAKLRDVGFRENDLDGNMFIPLAGYELNLSISSSKDLADAEANIKEKRLNCFFKAPRDGNYSPETLRHEFRVYREGILVGTFRRSHEVGFDYDDEDRSFRGYDYLDQEGKLVYAGVQQSTNEFFAASDLVIRLT